MSVDPVTAWTIAKTAGEISKKLYELGKGLKDREQQQKVDEIVDKLRDLKQLASELEDENREVREKLSSRATTTIFGLPFGIQKTSLTCPFARSVLLRALLPQWENSTWTAPGRPYRTCLVCNNFFRYSA